MFIAEDGGALEEATGGLLLSVILLRGCPSGSRPGQAGYAKPFANNDNFKGAYCPAAGLEEVAGGRRPSSFLQMARSFRGFAYRPSESGPSLSGMTAGGDGRCRVVTGGMS